MKILVFNWRDIHNPVAGGAEIFTHENAKRWVRKGNDVTLFAARYPDSEKEEEIDGVKIMRAGGFTTVYLKAWETYRGMLKGKFDVIVDEINTVPFFTPLYAREPKVALIHQLAREIWFREIAPPLNLLGYLAEPVYLRLYANTPTITISDSTKGELHNLGYRDVAVAPVGLTFEPLKEVPEKEDATTLIYVGRLKRFKGVHEVIEAFAIARASLRDAQLWVVGHGDAEYVDWLKRRAAELGVGGKVRFFGRVGEDRKRELMSRAHLLVTGSTREGWGLVVSEANAMGTPAVAYDVPGLRDSISDGRTGRLAARRNPEGLAGCIKEILSDGRSYSRMCGEALKSARSLSWEKSAEATLWVLEKAVDGKR